VTKESAAVCGREGVQGVGNRGDQFFQRPGGGLSQMGFEFGKGRLDRVEVGTVRWQVAKLNALGAEQGFHPVDLVRGQIVQYQRVAGLQARYQHLLQIDQKDLGIDRPIHQERSGDLFPAQCRQEGRTLPMAVRRRAQATFTPGTATVQAGQLGIQARLINEDQTRGVPSRLLAAPPGARLLNVGPVLLGGARRFF